MDSLFESAKPKQHKPKKKCLREGCIGDARAQGLCASHYQYLRITRQIPLVRPPGRQLQDSRLSVRIPAQHHQRIMELGGAQWVRDLITKELSK